MKRKINNGIFYVVISLIAVLGIGSIVAAYSLNTTNYFEGDQIINEVAQNMPEEVSLGGFPGPDMYSDIRIHGSLTTGGTALATSTSGTSSTLEASDLIENSQIDFVVNTASYTLTLPATSTMMQVLPDVGDSRAWIIHNATSTSGIVLTVVAGTGTDLVGIDTNVDTIASEGWARLTCSKIYYRTANNLNYMCAMEEYIEAD